VHRLDRDTSGLMVFALTPESARELTEQFRAHKNRRSYLAIVAGRPQPGRIESWLLLDRGDGLRGSGPEGQGEHALTHIESVEPLGEASLVRCRLETGRTHQLRIHLAEAGHPLLGDRVYRGPLGQRPLPDASGAPRQALHAAELGFTHPATGQPMSFTSDWPEDLRKLIGLLRSLSGKEHEAPPSGE
jgi:23S rRNA pseudouridine1911/1915/1917 synthase